MELIPMTFKVNISKQSKKENRVLSIISAN